MADRKAVRALWRLVHGLVTMGALVALAVFALTVGDVLRLGAWGRAAVMLACLSAYGVMAATGLLGWSRQSGR